MPGTAQGHVPYLGPERIFRHTVEAGIIHPVANGRRDNSPVGVPNLPVPETGTDDPPCGCPRRPRTSWPGGGTLASPVPPYVKIALREESTA